MEEKFEYLKAGRILNVDYSTGTCDVTTTNRSAGARKSIVYPFPYAGNGWGVLVGPEENSQVLLSYDKENRPWIVAYRPDSVYFNETVADLPNVEVTDAPYRRPISGEIVLQSKANSAIEMNQQGDIRLETADGLSLEINKGLETIFQQSVDSQTTTEAGLFSSGLVRRDIREDKDKELDVLFGSGFGVDTSQFLFAEILGRNPEYKAGDSIKGLYDPEYSEAEPGTSKNAALTEARFLVEEYADSNVGLDQVQLTESAKALGKMEVNRLMDIHLGTVVNDLGKIQRFDYGFGAATIGHGKIYSPSKDFFFNKNNTLKTPNDSKDYEKVVSRLAKINAAMLLKILLHTKGADSQGILESEIFRGALWSLLVDKEGLTKIEIPAATNLGDEATEPGRAGKSVLANLNGSLTLALGKELSPDTTKNSSITDIAAKSRKDRSLTMDAAGNIELVLGADLEKKQSLILAADGSIEAKIGQDTDNQRSITFTTDGGVIVTINGADKDKNALVLNVTGNVNQSVTGDVQSSVSGKAEMKVAGDTTLDATGNLVLKGKKVELGGEVGLVEAILKGETFLNLFNAHVHLALGAPTSPPTPSIVSGTVLSKVSTTV